MTGEPMNRRDRDQLAQVAKMRAKLAKNQVEAREAALLAQVEEELKAVFDKEEDHKKLGYDLAADWLRTVGQAELTERLDQYDIPANLRPMLGLAESDSVQKRGDTPAGRRGFMRGLAVTKIRALGIAARNQIDSACADTVTELITGGLSSTDAHKFLDAMPTVDQLMLAPSIAELESIYDEQCKELGR